jgi:methylmalonyl-CoA mutase N-terminal domain/subunit
MDETLSLPTEKAAEIALRTQQLLAYETGVANVVDPLGGSYFIENLTNEIEKEAEKYFKEIDDIGGVIIGIEDGYFQREIAQSASAYQLKVDDKERVVVGVNKFVNENDKNEIPILDVGTQSGQEQVKKLKELKSRRDNAKVKYSLDKIKKHCKNNKNLVPIIIDAAKNNVTMGEIVEAMKTEFGEWSESSVF